MCLPSWLASLARVALFLSIFPYPSFLLLLHQTTKDMRGLHEILTERKWMVNPNFVHSAKKMLEANLNSHTAFVRLEKKSGYVSAVNDNGNTYFPEDYQISFDGKRVLSSYYVNSDSQDFPFVSVIDIDGPVTRNGGGCSYGSQEHRDIMMRAADNSLCRGHVFIINTPGGAAWAKNDYQQAIDYARSKGQPVLTFIDGQCASMGMYIASLCDERYYMHPKDEIGCIGVMAAFYTEADGSKNEYTNETYHELYDPASFDKNKSIRDIANDGNDEDLIKELTELGKEFRNDVKKACPLATEVHLHGKVFNAEDVNGILVDGQSTFMDVVQRAFSLYNKKVEPIKREKQDEQPLASLNKGCEQDSTVSNASMELSTIKQINMQNYPLINAACGLASGEINVEQDGAFMNISLLDALETNIDAVKQDLSAAQAEATRLNELLANSTKEKESLIAQLNETNEAKLAVEASSKEAIAASRESTDSLNAEHLEAIATKEEQIKTLTQRIETLEEELGNATKALATAEQNLADRDAQIVELTSEAGEELNEGEAPNNNGENADANNLRKFNPSAYKSNSERKEAFERFVRGE